MVWHSPVYLVLWHFKSMEAILKSCVWGDSRYKLPWSKLKSLNDLGGMALPDFMYYLTAQLSQLFHIEKTDRARFLTFLCPKWSHSTDPFVAVAGGGGCIEMGDRQSLFYHYRCVWEVISDKLKIPHTHDFTPLWTIQLSPNSAQSQIRSCGAPGECFIYCTSQTMGN